MVYKAIGTALFVAVLLFAGAILVPNDTQAADKVAICHYPSEDPAKFDVLWVSPTAAQSHLAQHAIDNYATNTGTCIYDPM